MKFLSAVLLGTVIGIGCFILAGPYIFNNFELHLSIIQIPLMMLGKDLQIFILSTFLAVAVIGYEKFKRKKDQTVVIPPALHHKVTSILDPTHQVAANEALQYAFDIPKPSRLKQFALLLPIAVITFFLSAFASNKILSQEIASTINTPIATQQSVLSVTTQSTNTLQNTPTKQLIISEVYYKPDITHRINNSTNESEWIEIFNPGATAVSLAGWSIKDAQECDNIPANVVLGANKVLLISPATKEDFSGKWALAPTAQFITIPGRIGNGLEDVDEISLQANSCTSATQVLVDKVRWGKDIEFSITQNNPATPGIK